MKKSKRIQTVLAVAVILTLVLPWTAFGAVWTDQQDYSPGDVVTIYGDNSNGAGYLVDETVDVTVTRPDGSTDGCSATVVANDDLASGGASWSCTVTLNDDASAFGSYAYTATGQGSGVLEYGTFTDSPKIGTVAVTPNPAATFAGSILNMHVTVDRAGTGAEFVACLSTIDLPTGWSAVFDPTSLQFNGNPNRDDQKTGDLDVTIPSDASGDYSFTVKAIVCDQGADLNDSATVVVNVTVYQPLDVTKSADATLTRTWSWTIDKQSETTELTLAIGQSGDVDYTVTVDASSADSDWAVSGQITVENPNAVPFDVTVADEVDNGGTCSIEGSDTATVPAKAGSVNGSVQFDYSCDYPTSGPTSDSGTNTATATVTLDQQDYEFTGTQDFEFVATEVDECIDVSDDLFDVNPPNLDPATVCAGVDSLPKTFSYTGQIGPYASAGSYTVENTASFVTNDTGAAGRSSWTVDVTVVGQTSFSQVTSSGLCTFDTNSAPGDQFNLIFTQDPKAPTTYKLTASNPGQFYYNAFYAVQGGATTLFIAVPSPFVTQGAVPIHVYDGVEVYGDTCYTPGAPVSATWTPVSGGYNVTFNSADVTSGLAYVAIHLDYGLKSSGGFTKVGTNDAGGSATITNLTPYAFSFSDTGGQVASDTVSNYNIFKKNPGGAGMSLKAGLGDPVAGVKVQVYDANKKLLATVTSDQDGYYQWVYKYTGKAATFTVKLPAYNRSQAVTLKANGFVEVNFTDLP